MRITTNPDNSIFSVTPDDSVPTGTLYTGPVPDDFLNTFALGKYTFDGISIIETPGWIAP